MNSYLVVMAGGSGTRFWPKSTAKKPKQLLSFQRDSERTLIVETLERFEGLVPEASRWIVTTELLAEAVRTSVSKKTRILAEPAGRNTAPCVYWAAREVAAIDPKALMLVMPSDHYIPRLQDFQNTVRQAMDWAHAHDDLVTLGVKPDRPETGYGYLNLGAVLKGKSGQSAQRVARFVEKPSPSKAEEFLKSGQYLWNAGMFVWRAEVILAAFDRCMPEMKKIWQAHSGQVNRAYPELTATSIDFGVMEKSENVVTFPLDCGWDDLGSWTSLDMLGDALELRQEGGVLVGGELIAVDSLRNIVDAPGKLVALLGVDDLIVVEQGQSILVAKKDRAQDIRKIVEKVKQSRPDLA